MPDGGGAGEEIDSAPGSVLRWRIEAFQNAFDLLCERGKFVLQDVPDDVLINAEVLMDQDVSQPGDPLPLDFGITGANVFCQWLR